MTEVAQALCALQGLVEALIAEGRWHALAQIAAPALADKEVCAAQAVARFEQAARLEALLEADLGQPHVLVRWTSASRPDARGALIEGRIEPRSLAAGLRAQRSDTAWAARQAQAALHREAAAHLWRTVGEIAATLGPTEGEAPTPRESTAAAETGVQRAVTGPYTRALDPLWSKESVSTPRWRERPVTDAQHAPDLWAMSLREAMAADLCALCLLEHDGLPLAFHRDFAKQAWDEVRHARMYFESARALLPDFVAEEPGHPLAPGVRAFLDTGAGLPLPPSGDHYEAMWCATLTQRLVFLQIDGEEDLPAGFRDDLASPFYQARPDLSARLRWSILEEEAHARQGRRWLEELLPEPEERAAEIAQAQMFRGALLIAGLSARHQVRIGSLLDAFRSSASHG